MVSDIDDTVMVTALPRPLLAAWHTFVVNEHARSTTPGMPVLYERLTTRHPGAPVIYLSTGAWNVAPTLTRFLSRNLYPAGAAAADRLGPDRRPLVPQRPGAQAQRIWNGWPGSSRTIRWLLVGDDGQHDEAIYGELRRAAPRQRRCRLHPPADPGRSGAGRQQRREHTVGQAGRGALAVRARRRRTGRRTRTARGPRSRPPATRGPRLTQCSAGGSPPAHPTTSTIQVTPKRSVSIPNAGAHCAGPNGSTTVAPSASPFQ